MDLFRGSLDYQWGVWLPVGCVVTSGVTIAFTCGVTSGVCGYQ